VKSDQPHSDDLRAQVLEDAERRQQNTLWPNAMVNGSSVDGLLWKGSAKATKVQRVGIAIWGLTFLGVGICWLLMARERHDALTGLVGTFFLLVGTKITFNVFKRPSKRKGKIPRRNK
jgi:hypothetical protein